ncbi:MAG: RnfABCDGE type electron transport complex subunit D [Rickettsiales bacterium]|nr:RnfABCDGE type electron transport complex subunit D [Rickettsiales bacterium]
MTVLEFQTTLPIIATILSTALLTQWLGLKRFRAPDSSMKSGLITALSLCLLLRVTEPIYAALSAILAIGSKFVLRHRDGHIFNPANLGIVLPAVVLDEVWISPGQWGTAPWLVFLIACLALVVLPRARSYDISLAFLGCYALLLFGRATWLGDPMVIPLHQLQSGALLLFAFFMISDPKTIPAHRGARILFALAIAILAYIFRFGFYTPEGLLYALTLLAPVSIILNRMLPSPAYQWPQRSPS